MPQTSPVHAVKQEVDYLLVRSSASSHTRTLKVPCIYQAICHCTACCKRHTAHCLRWQAYLAAGLGAWLKEQDLLYIPGQWTSSLARASNCTSLGSGPAAWPEPPTVHPWAVDQQPGQSLQLYIPGQWTSSLARASNCTSLGSGPAAWPEPPTVLLVSCTDFRGKLLKLCTKVLTAYLLTITFLCHLLPCSCFF